MSLSLQLISFSILSLFILLAFLLSKWFLSASRINRNRPPSPPKLPIIGNLHQLSLDTHRSLQALAQRHGPLMLLHFGSVPVLIASSANAAREIMKTHDLNFLNRPKLSIPDRLLYGSKDITFSPYGEYWRQLKSTATVHLLSNTRVRSYRHVREEETALMIEKIAESRGSVVDLSELLVSVTNNIVCRVALGRTYHGQKFKDMLGSLMELLGFSSISNYIPWLSWVDKLSGLHSRADKVAKEFDEFLEGVVEEHLDRKRGIAVGGGEGSEEGAEGQDLVDIFLQIQREKATGFPIQRESIKAVILDIFAAGTDTTFTNLEWAITELVRHPQAMRKLQQEVREIAQGRSKITEDDLDKMQYLKAILKETLRLHAPIPLLVPRVATEDVKLMGYDIAAGTQVLINAWAIGRDPSSWEEPEEFRPERFLNSSIDYKGFHFELLPFGAGRRGCPGIQFAIAVNEIALANLVYQFDLSLPGGGIGEDLDMSETTGISAHKKSPLLVVATPHSQ